ncbi:MAG: nicotinate-nucleotide adenylyltransferase [Dehalococcoidia bacterium]
MVKRGVLGGSFDPIHIGHLLIAEEVRQRLGLDEVVFVPAGQPWMKTAEALATASDRWEMVTLAIGDQKGFVASRVDLERAGPSYAGDTVRDLWRERGPADDCVFIMGMDALATLPEWHEVDAFLRLCRVAVVERLEVDRASALERLERELPGAAERVCFVQCGRFDINATDIRRRVKEGRSIKHRVPPAVEEYIIKHGLYC